MPSPWWPPRPGGSRGGNLPDPVDYEDLPPIFSPKTPWPRMPSRSVRRERIVREDPDQRQSRSRAGGVGYRHHDLLTGPQMGGACLPRAGAGVANYEGDKLTSGCRGKYAHFWTAKRWQRCSGFPGKDEGDQYHHRCSFGDKICLAPATIRIACLGPERPAKMVYHP